MLHSHGDITKWIYHADTINSLHRAHSLQVTRGQGTRLRLRDDLFEAKAKAKAKAMIFFVLELSSRSRTVLEDHIPDYHHTIVQNMKPAIFSRCNACGLSEHSK